MIVFLLLWSALLNNAFALVEMGPGRIGVNVLGFRAGVDLNGGLSAYAESPFGKAEAGLGPEGLFQRSHLGPLVPRPPIPPPGFVRGGVFNVDQYP